MTNEITNEELARLKALAEAATPGPWTVCRHLQSVEADLACTCGYRGSIFGPDHDVPMAICQPGHDPEIVGEEGMGPQNYSRSVQISNAQHIAAANPATILALIAKVESLAADAERFVFEHSQPEAMIHIEMAALSLPPGQHIDWYREQIDAAMAKEKA